MMLRRSPELPPRAVSTLDILDNAATSAAGEVIETLAGVRKMGARAELLAEDTSTDVRVAARAVTSAAATIEVVAIGLLAVVAAAVTLDIILRLRGSVDG